MNPTSPAGITDEIAPSASGISAPASITCFFEVVSEATLAAGKLQSTTAITSPWPAARST